MKSTTIALAALFFTSALFSCASTQDGGANPAHADAAMEMPKPGPEHELLASGVGTWDATVTDFHAGTTSKAVSTRRMTGGGFWLVEDFTGEMMGGIFSGHGITGYDQVKQKYVGVWVDSMGSSMMTTEGTYDTGRRQFVSEGMMSMGADQIPVTMISKDIDDDTQEFTMMMPGEDGKQMATMKIDYKRRK